MTMKLLRIFWGLTLCLVTPSFLLAQIKVDPRYEPFAPIVAECTAIVPPGRTTLSASATA